MLLGVLRRDKIRGGKVDTSQTGGGDGDGEGSVNFNVQIKFFQHCFNTVSHDCTNDVIIYTVHFNSDFRVSAI